MKTLLSRAWWPYPDENAGAFLGRRWALVLAGVVLATLCAVAGYELLDVPQQYSEPVVGAIAWTLSNKFHDYAVLFSLVGGFLLSFALLTILSACLTQQIGSEAEESFQNLLVLLSAPAGLWFAGLLTTKDTSLLFLELAGLFIGTASLFAFLLQWRRRDFWNQNVAGFSRVLQKALLALGTVAFAVVAVGLLVSRAGLLFPLPEIHPSSVYCAVVVGVTLCALGIGVAILVSNTAASLEGRLDSLILWCQLIYPAYFLTLVPVPWRVDGKLVVGYPMSAAAVVFICLCMLVAFAGVIDLIRRVRRAPHHTATFGLITLPAAIGVLLFLKGYPVGIASVNPDDYHFGEMIVPWWSLVKQHMIPFWDYAPARGLMNYVLGAANKFFFNGTAASFEAATLFVYLGVLAVIVPVLAATIGRGPAVLALFLGPYVNWLSEIDIVVTAFLCLLGAGFLRWGPVKWLVVTYCAAISMLLYAPGQGALAIMATSPLAAVMLYRAIRDERGRTIRAMFVLLVLSALIGFLTPAGKMFVGAIRYGVEQSAINSIAHGVNWSATFGMGNSNPWLFEIARSSWLLVAMLAGLLLLKEIVARSDEGRARAFAFALPIFIVTVVFIIRAAGRIDLGGSRLGIASIWALALLLPVLIFGVLRPKAWGLAVFAWVTATGLISPHVGGIASYYVRAFEPLNGPAGAAEYVEGSKIGLPELGSGIVQTAHLNRLVKIRRILDTILDRRETYLDLTGRHGTYFYFNRRPPIETGSAYNLVTESQQLRAIESFRRQNPPAVLISADNILHDGGPASLRAHLLYRFLLLDTGYKVVKTGDLVWLIRPDRIERLSSEESLTVMDVSDAADNPLHDVFRTINLASIPASWGRSASSLESRMREVSRLPERARAQFHNVDQVDLGTFRFNGKDPFIIFDVSRWNLAGRQAGILAFDFACRSAGSPKLLEFYWSSERNHASELTVVRFDGQNGRLLVPLDAAPAWLLADKIKTIRFDIGSRKSCRTFSIQNVTFYQRHGVVD